MIVRKNAKPCLDPSCDRCRDVRRLVASTHRVQVTANCSWQWLCDDHTRQAIIDDANWHARNGETFEVRS